MLDVLDGEMLEQFGNRAIAFLQAFSMAPSYSSELPIAFSKIDGFDVTPLDAVGIRSAFSDRPWRRSRGPGNPARTAWPWFSSALTGFMMPVLFELAHSQRPVTFRREGEFCQPVLGGC